MKVLYFSSTGNSLYVAKKLNGELVSIPKLIKEDNYTISDDVIGIVFPVYWISVPALVRNFLKKAILNCDYLFGIVTYGDNMFGAINDLDTLPLKNNRKFDYIRAIKMTENYLPMYEMEKEIEKATSYGMEESIKEICDDIEKQVHSIPKISWFSNLLTNVFKKKHCMNIGAGEATGFIVTSDCVACGQCVKICPMNNVKLVEGKISFGKHCADCLGCVQNCPKTAIHVKGEKSGERYRHPEITVKELENQI